MMSCRDTSASAIFLASWVPTHCSKWSQAFFRAARLSGVMRSQASSAQSASSVRRTSSTSLMLFSVIRATSAPFLGIMVTSPSSSRRRMASRTGVRLTPSLSARWSSIRRSPGFSSPMRMAWRKVLKTTSLSGRSESKELCISILPCENRFRPPASPAKRPLRVQSALRQGSVRNSRSARFSSLSRA